MHAAYQNYFSKNRKEFIVNDSNLLINSKREINYAGPLSSLLMQENYIRKVPSIIVIIESDDRTVLMRKNIKFNNRFDSLLNFPSESWEEDKCPEWLMEIPITKPGSTGK